MPRRLLPTALVGGFVLVAGALAGCSDDPAPDPVEPAPAAFDCDAIGAARTALDDRGAAELERLGLTATDPQALTVTVVAAGTGAPAYWAAVRDALTDEAPPSVRADVDLVEGYWAALEPELAAVTLPDASPETVRVAGEQLSALAAGAPDGALAPAQDRVEDAISRSCG